MLYQPHNHHHSVLRTSQQPRQELGRHHSACPCPRPGGLISKPAWPAPAGRWSHTLFVLHQAPQGGGVPRHPSSRARFLLSVPLPSLSAASFSQCRFLLSVPLPSLSVALSSSPVSQPVLDSPSLLKTEQHSASGWITPGSPTTRRRGLGCCHLLVAVS